MTLLLDVALPVFAIILAGYLCGRSGLLGAGSSEALNRFVYFVAMPALLLGAMARVPVREALNLPFLAAFGGGAALTFVLAFAALTTSGRLAERALAALSASFANVGYMGIPLFLAAYGADRVLPAVIATALYAAVFIGVVVVLIELDLSPAQKPLRLLRDIARGLVRNPLVMAPAIGLALSAVGLRLAAPVETFTNLVGAAAGPCALFALGLFLVGKPFLADLRELAVINVAKLLVQPALTAALVHAFALEPRWAAAAIILAALPTGALVFTLAQSYGLGVERASSATLLSTLLSVVTVSAVLVLLG